MSMVITVGVGLNQTYGFQKKKKKKTLFILPLVWSISASVFLRFFRHARRGKKEKKEKELRVRFAKEAGGG